MQRLALIPACLLIAWLPASGQEPEQIRITIGYLRGLQTDSGGFTNRTAKAAGEELNPPSLRATTGALRALKYFGGEAKDPEAAKRFVARCFDKTNGGFADTPGGKPDVTTTAVGLMALVELKMPLDGYRDPAVKYLGQHARGLEDIRIAAAGLEAAGRRPPQAKEWLKQIAAMRNDEGLIGKENGVARETGGAVVALLRLGGEVDDQAAVLRALKAGQRADGAYGKPGTVDSDLESTYRVMRAFAMLKDQPNDVKGLREFIAQCRNGDGGYAIGPNQPSTAGSTYYAAIILYWLTGS